MHSVKLPRAAMCTGASPTLFFAFTSHPGVRAHKNRPRVSPKDGGNKRIACASNMLLAGLTSMNLQCGTGAPRSFTCVDEHREGARLVRLHRQQQRRQAARPHKGLK